MQSCIARTIGNINYNVVFVTKQLNFETLPNLSQTSPYYFQVVHPPGISGSREYIKKIYDILMYIQHPFYRTLAYSIHTLALWRHD